MVLAWFPMTSSWNPTWYSRGLIHGIGRGVPNVARYTLGMRPSQGYLFPCSLEKMALFPQKQNLDFICSLFPNIACVPLFPLFLGLCYPVPLKNCPCSPVPQNPGRASGIKFKGCQSFRTQVISYPGHFVATLFISYLLFGHFVPSNNHFVPRSVRTHFGHFVPSSTGYEMTIWWSIRTQVISYPFWSFRTHFGHWMDGWMDGCMHACMHAWMDGRKGGWMDRLTNGRTCFDCVVGSSYLCLQILPKSKLKKLKSYQGTRLSPGSKIDSRKTLLKA